MQKAHIPGFQVSYLFERDGYFIYRRVIPQHLRRLAGQNEFKESLHTRDPSAAREMYNVVHSKYERAILQLRRGIPYDPQHMPELEQLRGVAGSHGVDYLSASEMIRRDDPRDFLRRFALWDQAGRPGGLHFDALFGAVDDPVKLSDTLSFYEEHVRDELTRLDQRSRDKKLNPKRAAIKQLIDFLGEDKPIHQLSRQDAREFRLHLIERIEAGEIIGGTANKTLGHVRHVLKVNIEQRDLDLTNHFAGMKVKEEKSSRPAFSVKYLRERWLAPGAFDGLREECRNMLWPAPKKLVHPIIE